MLLTIDIGNTNLHFGLYDQEAWRAAWRARTIHEKMGDEYAVLLNSFFESRGFAFDAVDAIVLASVVPGLTATFRKLCQDYLGLKPLVVGPETDTGIKLDVDNPSEVGPDRIVNAAAIHNLYGGPAICVDFGTATTFDAIREDGAYIGGAISPGIGLAHDALVNRAALLRSVDLEPPPSAIGRNTVTAMQSGLFLGYSHMISGLIMQIKGELSSGAVKVIATGGLAPVFKESVTVIDIVAPNLTLEGLRTIWERNTTSIASGAAD